MKFLMRFGLGLCLAMAAAAGAQEIPQVADPVDADALPELSAAQSARLQAIVTPSKDDWAEVDQLRQSEFVAVFEDFYGELLIAADGRYARVHFDHDYEAGAVRKDQPTYASTGRALIRGQWLELWQERSLSATPEFPPEFAAIAVAESLAELPAGSSVDQAIDHIEAQMRSYAAAEQAMQANAESESAAKPEECYLRLRLGPGELLLREQDLAPIAQAWDGQGPLWINRRLLWSKGLQASEAPIAGLYGKGFLIADPTADSVPEALRSLLRVDAIEVRIVETTDDPASREWSWGSTVASYRIDKGARHGIFEGMVLRASDEARDTLTVKSVELDSAIVAVYLQRFSSKDRVVEPLPGEVFTSRKESGQRQACGIDTSAAVRAQISAVRRLDEGKVDEDGFVWFEVDIDHGSRHGLELEQALSLEGGNYASGESRLRRLEANSATLLWRVHTGARDKEAPLPVVGGHVVTRAWERASEELFGF
ncbi:hypothetical protein [Aquimonas sp.]|jgi:hypothetical protein|uniref:hypothetical protein n=1 Tax=Aquimonas sp. TaxID=1872588 RepID=UPI0037C1843A